MSGNDTTVTVLAENTARGMGLLGEHGLALWIETPEACALFDTGQGLALERNAGVLGIALDCADAAVLSHGHSDHTGGLRRALERAPDARLFLHPGATAVRYSRREGRAHEIGMTAYVRESVSMHEAAVVHTTGPTEVEPGLFATGAIPRHTDFEDTGGPFFLDAAGARQDPIADDQALWIETAAGTVVLLGCAHAGAVNTIEFIREQTGRKPIRAVLGGMHLGAASPARLDATVEAFRALEGAELFPCHCTGSVATARMMTAFGGRCRAVGVGDRLSF